MPTVRAAPQLPRLLPLLDPEHFGDVAFYRALAAMGYRQVLLGGTGSTHLPALVAALRRQTALQIVVYPCGPEAVCAADLILLPDIMNSSAAHARPFGSGAVRTAMAVARTGCPWLPVAHFIQADSTACDYYDAEPVHDAQALLRQCTYARMVGYRHIALDYEGAAARLPCALARRLAQAVPSAWLTVSDEVCPARAQALLASGVDTVVVPSDLFEQAADPLALAHAYFVRLLA
ncbi:MAG: hypothetical protein K1X88_01530 [Nannocystaceae bacterium]|nr:hypothetical protein [Nannocystaceae bacterium]